MLDDLEEESKPDLKPMELFSKAVKISADLNKRTLFDEGIDLRHPVPGSRLIANLNKEIEQYFTTGNSGQHCSSGAKCVNPTLLQPKTGKWFVHHGSCPFTAYAPLPLKELDRSGDHNGVAFEYCRAELKKLLIGFRKRQENVTFHFHLSDPLAFCYKDSPLSFDVIDGSSFLADHVGLVNLLNAAARKLRSAQSVLWTESTSWHFVAPDVVGYLQTVLCCPLNLIPTIYGMRLIDAVELGPDTFVSTRNLPKLFSRLRWRKAQHFKGVALTMSPLLEQCLERLKELCFHVEAPSGLAVAECGMCSYSPLTFCYVMCDLMRRGGLPATAMETFQLPPVFHSSMAAIQAWKERRPVWRVNVCFQFDQNNKQTEFDEMWNMYSPFLRLVLVPNSAFKVKKCIRRLFTSTESHLIDNLDLNIKRKANGEIDQVGVSFLLADRNLLKNHRGIVFDYNHRLPIFMLGPISTDNHQVKVEKFSQPNPYWNQEDSSSAADCSSKLMPISCQESKDAFTFCFNFRPGKLLAQSGIQSGQKCYSVNK